MKITSTNGRIEINGQTFIGKNVFIENGRVIIDGHVQDMIPQNAITVIVTGDCGSVENERGNVTISGSVSGNVQTGSGDISCGSVGGNAQTGSGDISSGHVGGSIRSGSGDISHRVGG